MESSVNTSTNQTNFYNIFRYLPNNNLSLFNTNDKNSYVIALNDSSNALFFSFLILFLFILYILIMYLCSFIFIPINTIRSESHMFSSLIFNPDSANTIFTKFIKSKLEQFTNISDSSKIIELPIHKITDSIKMITDSINYWFHRGILYLYINKGSISSVRLE